MRISTKTRYGLRFLLELAGEGDRPASPRRMTTQQIAKNQGISEKYLEAIAARLKKGGLVCAAKGQNGGYWLARPIGEIAVGDVVRIMETEQFLHCSGNFECCPRRDSCAIYKFLEEMETAMRTRADEMKLDKVK
ncbi:MAG: Rrf2 family transcriptional regulator [Clostridiales bacterium]|jgi:Rrf2 family protein|nr:Rrf2 family transcriptional regulator [Clostridiales bacterium]